jgi:hypothetical protein
MKIFNPSLVSGSSLSRALSLLLCLSTLTLGACGEDSPPPNNAPTVVTAQSYAQCERREGDFALTEITFVIEDLEGSDTLSDPYVEFGSLSLPMTADPIAAPTEEETAAAEESENSVTTCPVESCQMRYTWIYQPGDSESALIGCPEDASQIFVRILDRNTNSKEFFLQPRRDE